MKNCILLKTQTNNDFLDEMNKLPIMSVRFTRFSLRSNPELKPQNGQFPFFFSHRDSAILSAKSFPKACLIFREDTLKFLYRGCSQRLDKFGRVLIG